MKFCALASGSSGNCFFVKKGDTAILVDCGISSKGVVERLCSIKESPESIKAVFVTHEHIDHIMGIDVFANKFNVPVYPTRNTAESCFISKSDDMINVIRNNELVNVNGLKVEAFSKSHDAADPVSYSVEAGGKKLSVITDIGFACKNVIEHVSCSDSIVLESNYDVSMLKNGCYPAYLKKRVSSDLGHLSNYDAALLVLQHAPKRIKNIMLSHLSINNNTPEIALKTFNLIKERKDLNPKVCLSERYMASDFVRLK